MIRKTLTLLLAAILLAATNAPALALSDEQRRIFNSGVYYYDKDSNTACSNDSVALTGSDNIQKTYNFFASKGLTAEQAAGITGNGMQESSLDPSAVSKSGNYRGIFQWSISRWQGLEDFATNNNLDPDILETQLQFAFSEATTRGNMEGIKKYTTVELATWYWGRYFEGAIINGSRSEVEMTNVQHLDKRVDYAKQVLSNYGLPSTSTGTTASCALGNGQNTQYVDGFTIYSQYDPAWKDLPYSSSTIGESGCGPTAMAMIISSLTTTRVLPPEAADYAAQTGMYVPGEGSSWTIGPTLARHWGLNAAPVNTDVSAIVAALRDGKVVLAPGSGPLPFTSGGHFIVIRGLTADGKFKIADSAHKETNTQDWDPQFIVNNMRPNGSAYAIYK